jgi:hypothetical protein
MIEPEKLDVEERRLTATLLGQELPNGPASRFGQDILAACRT